MPSFIRPIVLLLSLAVAGCAGPLARWDGSAEVAAKAESLARMGDYEGARRLYQQLVQTSRDPDYYRLQAADAALRAGDGRGAQQLADAVNPRELERPDRNQWLLLRARLDLNAGRAREAMGKLNFLAKERLEGGQEIHYHTLRASAYNQLGNMLDSARERVLLGRLIDQPEAVQKNNEAIYDALGRLPDPILAGHQQPVPPDTLGGWMALTRILKSTPPGSLPTVLAEWRNRYPGHPADGPFLHSVLPEMGSQVRITPLGQRPRSEAQPNEPTPMAPEPAAVAPPSGPFFGVLLPLSGPYAQAAQAIRAGLIAAYYADPNPDKAQLRFLDSQSGDAYQLYRKLVDEGAQAVIGPLIKENVAVLAKGGDLPVPVLALNQANEDSNEQLYQFGLTPEHEVEQAASSAWFDGRQNALILAPATQFGQRMIKHFVSYWRTLGGKVLTIKTYPHHGGDVSAAIKSLVAAAASAPTQAATLPVPAAPASTSDFIFMIADVRDARAIMPQIAVHQGGRLPVYSTSHVYNGKTDAQADQDLNGLTFCDIPWLLNPDDGGPLAVRALNAQIQQTPPDYVKLIALGIDAYRLIPELDRFGYDPQYRYPGATGTLSLQSGNRLQRQLQCASFENGSVQPRGIAPVVQPGVPAATGR